MPFSRADVEWLPDDEETNEWQPLIEHVLQAVDSEVSLLSVMQATSAAGHAAAVASAEVRTSMGLGVSLQMLKVPRSNPMLSLCLASFEALELNFLNIKS